MADTKKENQETPQEIDTTVKCGSCGKTLYQNEICSCQRKEVPSWMPSIKSEIPLKERDY